MSDPRSKVRADILSFLKNSRAEVGHAFNSKAFLFQYALHYNQMEKQIFTEVLSELVSEGILESSENQWHLTSTGFDAINPSTHQEVVQRVKHDILSFFRDRNSDVGHTLNEKAFLFGPALSYSSKERAAILEAVNELVAEGLVEDKNGNTCLTQEGVDAIYSDKD